MDGALRSSVGRFAFAFERALPPLVARGPVRAAGRPGGAPRPYGAWGRGQWRRRGARAGRPRAPFFRFCRSRRFRQRQKVVSWGDALTAVHRSPLRP